MFWSKKRATELAPVLQERLEKVEAAMRRLQLEWENTYELIRSGLARLNARARWLRDKSAEAGRRDGGTDLAGDSSGLEGGAAESDPTTAAPGGASPDPISAAIRAGRYPLARRLRT